MYLKDDLRIKWDTAVRRLSKALVLRKRFLKDWSYDDYHLSAAAKELNPVYSGEGGTIWQ